MDNNKPMVICILGRSCSGKDLLSQVLRAQFNIEPIVSYTTKPKRQDQIEGKDHIFISGQEYLEKFANTYKIAYTNINGYSYFTMPEQFYTLKPGEIRSYILDPFGYQNFRAEFRDKINIYTIYLLCNYDTRRHRSQYKVNRPLTTFNEREIMENIPFQMFEHQELVNCDLIINSSKQDFWMEAFLNIFKDIKREG